MPIKKLKVKSQKSKLQVKTQKLQKRISGLTVDVFNTKGKVTGKVTLPKEIFGAKVNDRLMAQAVRVYLANKRQGTVSTKTRGEVKGSTRKLYRQKGTGRARAGSIRSPLRVGGGIVFGPKPRDFSLKLPKKMKRVALFSALSSKLTAKAIKVIDGLGKITPKTAEMVKVLKSNELPAKGKILLVMPHDLKNVDRAARNIAGINIVLANSLNTLDILKSQKLLIIKDAIEVIKKTWIK